jgi:hypothetical protein
MPTAIVIPADREQPLRVEEIEQGGLAHCQRLVGGYIQVINLDNPPCSMYLNEDGKVQELPLNKRATAVMWVHNPVFFEHDIIVGDALITGPPDDQGYDTDVPKVLEQLLLNCEGVRIEIQKTEDGPWIATPGRYPSWSAAYMEAIEMMKTDDPIEAVRAVPA